MGRTGAVRHLFVLQRGHSPPTTPIYLLKDGVSPYLKGHARIARNIYERVYPIAKARFEESLLSHHDEDVQDIERLREWSVHRTSLFVV